MKSALYKGYYQLKINNLKYPYSVQSAVQNLKMELLSNMKHKAFYIF